MLLALASLVLTGGTFLVVANPADLIRDRLVAQVQLRTGHDLAVAGETSLTLFPSLGVVMRDVALSATRDASAPPVLSAKAVTARLAWQPLMEGRIAARSVAVRQPVLDLAVDAEGRPNWDFAAIAGQMPAAPVRVAQLAPRFQHGQGLPPELYEALERSSGARAKSLLGSGGLLQDVSVTDAAVRYRDARTGATRQIAGIDLSINLEGKRARFSGSGMWAGERVALDGELQDAGTHAAKLALRASARPLEATWDGRVVLASGSPELDGQVAARATSASALARWIGKAPSGDALNGPASVEGRLRMSGATFDLSDARLTLDGATATGSIGVEPMRQRPLIRADLEIAELDLDRYLGSGTHDEAQAPSSASEAAGSIGDLLRRTEDEGLPPPVPPKAQVRGFTQRAEAWSTQPIDLGMLRLADLTGKFTIGRLVWRQIEMGASHATVSLDGGVLKAEVEGADVYGGRGKAVLSVHADGSAAVVGLNASVDDAAALPLMRDAAGFDWVEGRSRLTLALTAQGASEREMIERLNGRADFSVADGAVIGWDVTHMLRRLRQGQLTALDRNRQLKTPFTELSGSFDIVNGTATNRDLRMTGPAVQLAGSGTIALPQRAVDYTVRPTLVIAAATGSGTAESSSIEVPVRIQGAWAQPKFSVDLQGALADPRTADTIQKVGRQLRSGNVEEAVKGILGDGPEAEEKAAKAKKFLRQFLQQ